MRRMSAGERAPHCANSSSWARSSSGSLSMCSASSRSVEARHDFRRCRTAVDERGERVAIEPARVVAEDCVTVTFFEVADEIRAERRGPADAAFEEREPQRRETVHHAAEEQRPAQRFARGRERTDVIRHVTRRRRTRTPAHAGGVEGRRDAEIDEALPQRVVVVRGCRGRACRASARRAERRRPGAAVAPVPCTSPRASRTSLTASSSTAIASSGAYVGTIATGSSRSRRPVVRLRVVAVERARGGDAQVGIVEAHHRQAVRGVDDGDVDAELVEPFVLTAGAASRSRGRACSRRADPTTTRGTEPRPRFVSASSARVSAAPCSTRFHASTAAAPPSSRSKSRNQGRYSMP